MTLDELRTFAVAVVREIDPEIRTKILDSGGFDWFWRVQLSLGSESRTMAGDYSFLEQPGFRDSFRFQAELAIAKLRA